MRMSTVYYREQVYSSCLSYLDEASWRLGIAKRLLMDMVQETNNDDLRAALTHVFVAKDSIDVAHRLLVDEKRGDEDVINAILGAINL